MYYSHPFTIVFNHIAHFHSCCSHPHILLAMVTSHALLKSTSNLHFGFTIFHFTPCLTLLTFFNFVPLFSHHKPCIKITIGTQLSPKSLHLRVPFLPSFSLTSFWHVHIQMSRRGVIFHYPFHLKPVTQSQPEA